MNKVTDPTPLIEYLTPPLPLPYKGGEGCRLARHRNSARHSPPFKGRGWGWGLDSALPLGLSKNLIIPSYFLMVT
jgi:hypothetical protein